MRILLLPLITIFFYHIEIAKSSALLDQFCSEEIENAITHERHLISACLDNNNCARMYNLKQTRINETVFDFLTASVTRKYYRAQTTPLRELLCKNKSFEQLDEHMWLMAIMANRDQSQIICGVNQQLEIQRDGTSACVCSESSNCGVSSHDLTILYVIASSILLALTIMIVLLLIPLFAKSTLSDFIF